MTEYVPWRPVFLAASVPPATVPPAYVPPDEMIAAVELALTTRLAGWSLNLAPAALRMLAIDALTTARTTALARMYGTRHG